MRTTRPAFTLVEVMFAVIVLGIGLTMTAAMFPVAIAQTRQNLDDTTAATVGKSAVATLEGCFTNQSVPDTGGAVQPLTGPLRERIYGNLISNIDPKYAWVPLYRRSAGDYFAQVIVFVVRNRNRSLYVPGVDLPVNPDDTTGTGATLDPQAVTVTLEDGGVGEDHVSFDTGDAANSAARVASGGFLVIASPPGAAGRTYRIGNLTDATTNTWSLAPGWDLHDASENLNGVTGYIVGRGFADPTDATKGYDGPAQDIMVYTAFVPASN